MIVQIAATNHNEFGTTKSQKVAKCPNPSIRAASSSSRGDPRKYWRIRNVADAWNSAGMIRPRRVLIQPTVDTRTKLGTNMTAAGMNRVATVAYRTPFDQRYGMRARP